MKEKLIASFLAALMLFTQIGFAQTALQDYPDFLAEDGALDAYVVVGTGGIDPAGLASDIAGAIDLALRLAELSFEEKTVSGAAAAIDGIGKDTIGLGAALSTKIPNPVKAIHYTGLMDSSFSWRGNDYDYYEDVQLGNTYMSHDFATDKINGTEKMIVASGQIIYEYVFDKALSGTGSIADPNYTYPVNIQLLGKDFSIVGTGSNSIKALAGTVGTATSTAPVVSGDYSVYSDLGYNAQWARLIVQDAEGNTVDTKVVNQGDSWDVSAASLSVKVLSVRALQDGTVVGADLVVGPTGLVEKTYTTSCDVTSTGTEEKKFPGETLWCIQVKSGTFGTPGSIDKGDTIQVAFKPEETQYIIAGGAVALPNDYGEVGFLGWNTDNFVEVRVEPFTEKTVYNASVDTQSLGTWSGFEVKSDVSGSILDTDGTGYDRAYVLFNKTVGENSAVGVAFYDSVKQKVLLASDATHLKQLNKTDLTDSFSFTFNISYGGASALADQHLLNVVVNDTAANVIQTFSLTNFAGNTMIAMSYGNKTVWPGANLPTFRLYDSDSAQERDVYAATSGDNVVDDEVGKATQDIVTDGGAIIVAPGSHSGSQRVVFKSSAETLYVHAYVGKLGSIAGEVTYHDIVPVTAPVAVLDSEVTATHKAKSLVTVGGPCINSITAAALDLEYPACGAASTIPTNKAIIQVVDDVFTTGKVVVVVAGWEADDTRTACSVLQQYESLLSGITASKIEVTAATAAGITEVTE